MTNQLTIDATTFSLQLQRNQAGKPYPNQTVKLIIPMDAKRERYLEAELKLTDVSGKFISHQQASGILRNDDSDYRGEWSGVVTIK